MYGGELTVGINVTSEIKPLKKVLFAMTIWNI